MKSVNKEKLKNLEIYQKVAFEFKDGWIDLVYNLGKDIEDLCKLTNCELPLIQQIKEKFGTLCFYYNTLNSEYPGIVEKSIRALVLQAVHKSSNTCEICGKYGEIRVENRVYTTVCEEHKDKSIKNKTYFGLEIYQDNLIKEKDIKELPFYEFWKDSIKGSTQPVIEGEIYVYLYDFESFSKLFIEETGSHRFQKTD
ncbi:hypothetical protein NG769_05690 [Aliarcobacter cryaerophilus]|uniref:hypothetical protein n=1 Tax=Aliarcobacter cryaerophilus TaxID=28198 RepID=UPI003DA221C3